MKIFIIICAVIVCVLAAALVYIIRPKDVAIVLNNKVTNNEFKYYFMTSLQQTALLSSYFEDEQQLIDYTKQMALSQAVQVEYLLQEAQKDGFKLDQKDLNDSWDKEEKYLTDSATQYNMSVKEFCKQLYGVDLNLFKTIYTNTLTAQRYMDAKIDEVPVEEEELSAYYEENKATFDTYTVRHILISVEEDADEAVVEEKSKTAQEILDRVNNGEDFAALVKEFTEDDGSKETGGLYEVTENSNFVEEFKEWAMTHKAGETGIVKSQFGFHIMKHEGITDTLEANREKVEKQFKTEKYQTAMNEKLNDISTNVKILDGYEEFEY